VKKSTYERHGMTGTKVHAAWAHMVDRCTNPANPSYCNYGGRGIVLCTEWRESFAAFYAEVGDPPHRSMTLERIDNERGYEPGNCRWATYTDQVVNQRLSKRNRSGLKGVCWDSTHRLYKIQMNRHGKRLLNAYAKDFFEACCIRKSAENAL